MTQAPGTPLPHATIERVIETALYVGDLESARDFYIEVMGFSLLLDTPRLVALSVSGRSVLLLFARGATSEVLEMPGGFVPPHGAHGVQHIAFAIALESLDDWIARLSRAGIPIESTVSWDRGGRSIYIRDPEGHSIELATPGLWAIY